MSRMYDMDSSGSINMEEMINILATMDELEGDIEKRSSPAERYIQPAWTFSNSFKLFNVYFSIPKQKTEIISL